MSKLDLLMNELARSVYLKIASFASRLNPKSPLQGLPVTVSHLMHVLIGFLSRFPFYAVCGVMYTKQP